MEIRVIYYPENGEPQMETYETLDDAYSDIDFIAKYGCNVGRNDLVPVNHIEIFF